MKRQLIVLAFVGSLFACTSANEKSTSTDEKAEIEAADAIVQELNDAQTTIKAETDEALQEVDSLLNSL